MSNEVHNEVSADFPNLPSGKYREIAVEETKRHQLCDRECLALNVAARIQKYIIGVSQEITNNIKKCKSDR